MYTQGHYGAALVAYAPLALVTRLLGYDELAVLGGLIAVSLAMLPDVDCRIPFVPHRGPTHTVWFATVVGAVMGGFGWYAGTLDGTVTSIWLATFGFAVGSIVVLSHIAADSLTPMGVRPFTPFSSAHYSFGLTTADNTIANHVLLVVGAVVAGVAFVASGNAVLLTTAFGPIF